MDDWHGWRRPGPTGRQRRVDVGLAAAMVAGAALVTVLVNSMGAFAFGEAPSLAEQLWWGVALTAPLAVRRRFPATVVLVVAAVFIAAQARQIGDNTLPSLALFVALYTLGAWGRDRAVARWVRVMVIVGMFGWLGLSMVRDLAGPPIEFEGAAGPLDPLLAAAVHSIFINLLFFLGAYFFGNVAWESARRRHELAMRGEQLRRAQAENARQAVVAERVRIARDLHDVVAHHVSVMGIQAAAARRVLDSDPAQARTSLSAVEQTARTAVGELRDLVGVLRAEVPTPRDPAVRQEPTGQPDPAGQPVPTAAAGGPGGATSHPATPGLEQLPALVTEVGESSGLRTRYAEFGEPAPVPESVALSAYRVVQEALTNAVKHAGAGTVDVRVRYLERSLEVEISDDGRSANGTGTEGLSTAPGHGLIGMRERVAVHGGELEAGPRRDGGFQVRARFPIPERPLPAEVAA